MAGSSCGGGGMALSAEEESLVRTLVGPGHEIVSVEKEVKVWGNYSSLGFFSLCPT